MKLTFRSQFFNQSRPLGTKHICTSQRTITTTNNQPIDAFFDQIVRCKQSPLSLSKRFRSRRPNQSPTLSIFHQHGHRIRLQKPYLRKPPTNIIPPNTNNIPSFERSATSNISSPISQQRPISKPQIRHKRRVTYRSQICKFLFVRRGSWLVPVSSDKTFVSFAYDPSFATSAEYKD
jgi:hypothetical protein